MISCSGAALDTLLANAPARSLLLYFSQAWSWVINTSMRLKYEPSSEPLHIFATRVKDGECLTGARVKRGDGGAAEIAVQGLRGRGEKAATLVSIRDRLRVGWLDEFSSITSTGA